MTHVAVLLHEAVDALAIRPDGLYVDATFGRGGHSCRILEQLGPTGRLIALDRDLAAIEAGRAIADPRLSLLHARFAQLGQVLAGLGITAVDRSAGLTLAQWLNSVDEAELAKVIWDYGEERFAKQVAKAIVAARQGGPITRTRQLADVVGAAVRTREPGQDPATRTFQALRIHLNQELEELSLVLPQALQWLSPGGRLAVISFHSLEDRLVKNFMRDSARAEQMPERLPVRAADLAPAQMQLIGKPQRASAEELRRNPRARSATLRVAQKLALADGAAANGVQH